MDKISSILPSSKRVSTVDLKESGAVRPGAPTFGRPEGVSTLRDISNTSEAKGWKARDEANAGIARDLADRFFTSRESSIKSGPKELIQIEAPPMAPDLETEMVAAGVDDTAEEMGPQETYEPVESRGPFPKGSFLDRVA